MARFSLVRWFLGKRASRSGARAWTGRLRPAVEGLEERQLLNAGPLPSAGATFVEGLYRDLLGRVPQAGEEGSWVAALAQGAPRQQVVQGIQGSVEYSTGLIGTAYDTYLHRTPGAAEVASWLAQVHAGLGAKAMDAQFLGSGESYAAHGSDPNLWLTGLYTAVLGRVPDPTGRATWGQALLQGQSRQFVAQSILDSGEANTRLITNAYQTLLGRLPDPTGLDTFQAALGRGMDPRQLRLSLVSSLEYYTNQTTFAAQSGAPPRTLHFEFGTGRLPVAPGYLDVPLVAYGAARGYGWESTAGLSWRDRGTSDPVTRAFHAGTDGIFRVDVPDGAYQVTATLGDAVLPRGNVDLWANGTPLGGGLLTVAGQFLRPSTQVLVTGGKLRLHLIASGTAGASFAINALDLVPLPVSTPTPVTVLAAHVGPDQVANEGQAVTFTGALTGTAPFSYLWSFGDGSTTTGTLTPTHTYTDQGTYAVTLTVTDLTGRSSRDTAAVTVQDVAPTARAGGPYTPTTGTALAFAGSATSPSQADTAAGFSYLWSFGDGTRSTDRNPKHAYAQAGAYTVTLTVTDKDGASGSATTTAAVSDPFPIGSPDMVPDFGAHPTVVSVASGAWSDVHTWSIGRLPGTGDVVDIAANTTVTYDVVSNAHLNTLVVQAGGHLHFRTDKNTQLVVGNFVVASGGDLEIGTPDHPVAGNVMANIVFADQKLDLANDPNQYGTGFLGFGKVTLVGAAVTPTFARLAVEPQAGDTTLTLDQPVSGWGAGNELVLPDTRQLRESERGANYVPEWEELSVKSVSANGRVVTLASPLRYDHPGARNADDQLEFLPQVMNRSRNLMFGSENPQGTRGYVLFSGRADVDVRYTAFCNLGRTTNAVVDDTTYDAAGRLTHLGTNQGGRYAMYFYDLVGPVTPQADGYQFTALGNTVDNDGGDSPYKWGLTVASSSYGLVQDNVVYNVAGAGIVTEEGPESYNVIAHNFVVRVNGNGDRFGMGREGDGYWFRGPNNYVRDNVASDTNQQGVYNYGFTVFGLYLGNVTIPIAPGADPSVPGQGRTVDMNTVPLLEFSGNEAYGAMPNGLSLWGLGVVGDTPTGKVTGTSVVKDFRVWHFYQYGYFGYPSDRLTFDHFVARDDRAIAANPNEYMRGMWWDDYPTRNLVVQNADIQGMQWGIIAPRFVVGTATFANCYLRNATDFIMQTMYSTNGSTLCTPRQIVLRDDRFAALPGMALNAIVMTYDVTSHPTNLVQKDELFVYDYNGVAGDNFQVYYKEQAADFLVPQTVAGDRPLVGSPEAGLTNQQNWDKYHLAIADAVAPVQTKRPGIDGFVRPL